jgi:hypothetical protein
MIVHVGVQLNVQPDHLAHCMAVCRGTFYLVLLSV